MPLSTLTNMPQESSSSSSTNHNQMIVNNQNLLHVKFHVNKFQDNLLSKRLQQLNTEEMKQRLKHQRASNELVVFLKECQQTTGYLAKMKQIDNSHSQHHHNRNNHFRYNPNSSSSYNADNNNANNNPPLSNAVKNMINASILVVETSTTTSSSPFESKSCPNYAQLIKSENNSNLHRSHRKVAWVFKILEF